MKFINAVSLACCFFISFTSISQEQSALYKKYKDRPHYKDGTITKKDGQQVAGLIQYRPSEEDRHSNKVVFIAIDGVKKESLSAKDLLDFTVSADHFIAYRNNFYKRTQQGKNISLFKRPERDYAPRLATGSNGTYRSTPQYRDVFFFRKKNEHYLQPVNQNADQKIAEYFKDCPSLASKIRNGEFSDKKILGATTTFSEENLKEIVVQYDLCVVE
jgi:hypothetical protein